MKVVTTKPNYGRQKVGKTFGVLGKLAGGVPADRRGAGNDGVKVRRGR